MTRKNTAFSKADLKNWRKAMKDLQPGPMDNSPFQMMKSAASVTIGNTPTGLVLRFATKSGEIIDIFANPAVAETLAAGIPTTAQRAGWMDAKGRIIDPLQDI